MRNGNLESALKLMREAAQLDAVKAFSFSITELGIACVSAYSKAEDYTDDDCRCARVYLTDHEDRNRESMDEFMKEVRSWGEVMVREDRKMTTEKIAIGKTYNLGNYQSARLEMECSIPTTEVGDVSTINEYYGRAFCALDRAFEANFKSK